MALISFFDDPLDSYHPLDLFRPSRLLDQHFGTELRDEDLLSSCIPRKIRRALLHSPYNRNWRSIASKRDQGSTVALHKDKFQVNLDVQQFSPEEITVKASGNNTITIEGKHEEKQDEHGYISRHFVRRYTLPEGHDIEKVQSKLSSDGVLTITAPKVNRNAEERDIPITFTGTPSGKAIANGTEDSGKDHCENEIQSETVKQNAKRKKH